MTGGPWFDLLLLLLLVGAVVVLILVGRSRSVLAAGPSDPEKPVVRGWLSRLMRQAGFDPGSMLWIYWVGKLALAALLPLLVIEIWSRWDAVVHIAVVVLLAVFGFFVPDVLLFYRRKSRQLRVRNYLSYFLDLIVALLHSGLNLDQAFRRTVTEGMDPEQPLAQEAALVALELDVGQEHRKAFEAMAERTGVLELRGVAAALASGRRLGVSVQETLERQADLMRLKRRERALRTINLAALKTLLPVFLCGYPVFLVIVLLPVVLEIAEIFRDLLGIL